VAEKITMLRVMCDYQHDDACCDGSDHLHEFWKILEADSNSKTITLTKKRVLRPIHLGTYIMREERRNGKFWYSVVSYDEIEHEAVVSTTIRPDED
jgi:REP element-mobilizing transposase RayT